MSQVPANHEKMVHLRAEKVARVAQEFAPLEVYGKKDADLLILGWGGTRGVIQLAVDKLIKEGHAVASAHLRYMNPLPNDLKPLLQRYKKVLIPELNTGQLWYHLRAEFLMDFERLNKVRGQPFKSSEIIEKVKNITYPALFDQEIKLINRALILAF